MEFEDCLVINENTGTDKWFGSGVLKSEPVDLLKNKILRLHSSRWIRMNQKSNQNGTRNSR